MYLAALYSSVNQALLGQITIFTWQINKKVLTVKS